MPTSADSRRDEAYRILLRDGVYLFSDAVTDEPSVSELRARAAQDGLLCIQLYAHIDDVAAFPLVELLRPTGERYATRNPGYPTQRQCAIEMRRLGFEAEWGDQVAEARRRAGEMTRTERAPFSWRVHAVADRPLRLGTTARLPITIAMDCVASSGTVVRRSVSTKTIRRCPAEDLQWVTSWWHSGIIRWSENGDLVLPSDLIFPWLMEEAIGRLWRANTGHPIAVTFDCPTRPPSTERDRRALDRRARHLRDQLGRPTATAVV